MSITPAVRPAATPARSARTHRHDPVVITEHRVKLATAAALATPHGPGRLVSALSWVLHPHLPHLPPPHMHYPPARDYLESARMAREMDRL